jgi:hypothetical protein
MLLAAGSGGLNSADAVRGPLTRCRKAMTSTGFVDNRGALGGLNTALPSMPQILRAKPPALYGSVYLADGAVDQVGGDQGQFAALGPGLSP